MDQPIWLVVADDRPSTDLAAEILRVHEVAVAGEAARVAWALRGAAD